MSNNEIYKSLADTLCIAFIYGSNKHYQRYREEFKQHNLTIKDEPYPDWVYATIKRLEESGHDVGIDQVIREKFKRNRGSWEREQSAIRSALEELTMIGESA